MGLGSGIRKKPISNPRFSVKKAQDPGPRIRIRNTVQKSGNLLGDERLRMLEKYAVCFSEN
jgi:hypothetical protein